MHLHRKKVGGVRESLHNSHASTTPTRSRKRRRNALLSPPLNAVGTALSSKNNCGEIPGQTCQEIEADNLNATVTEIPVVNEEKKAVRTRRKCFSGAGSRQRSARQKRVETDCEKTSTGENYLHPTKEKRRPRPKSYIKTSSKLGSEATSHCAQLCKVSAAQEEGRELSVTMNGDRYVSLGPGNKRNVAKDAAIKHGELKRESIQQAEGHKALRRKWSASQLCKHPGCVKKNAGKGLCFAHGGGRPCDYPGCSKRTQRGKFCRGHGGRALCQHSSQCPKVDAGGGFCRAHGGGKRCTAEGGCEKADIGGGFCANHGGGARCRFVYLADDDQQPPSESSTTPGTMSFSSSPARSSLVSTHQDSFTSSAMVSKGNKTSTSDTTSRSTVCCCAEQSQRTAGAFGIERAPSGNSKKNSSGVSTTGASQQQQIELCCEKCMGRIICGGITSASRSTITNTTTTAVTTRPHLIPRDNLRVASTRRTANVSMTPCIYTTFTKGSTTNNDEQQTNNKKQLELLQRLSYNGDDCLPLSSNAKSTTTDEDNTPRQSARCTNVAQSGGFCRRHGGGKRCLLFPQCVRSCQGRSGYCLRHENSNGIFSDDDSKKQKPSLNHSSSSVGVEKEDTAGATKKRRGPRGRIIGADLKVALRHPEERKMKDSNNTQISKKKAKRTAKIKQDENGGADGFATNMLLGDSRLTGSGENVVQEDTVILTLMKNTKIIRKKRRARSCEWQRCRRVKSKDSAQFCATHAESFLEAISSASDKVQDKSSRLSRKDEKAGVLGLYKKEQLAVDQRAETASCLVSPLEEGDEEDTNNELTSERSSHASIGSCTQPEEQQIEQVKIAFLGGGGGACCQGPSAVYGAGLHSLLYNSPANLSALSLSHQYPPIVGAGPFPPSYTSAHSLLPVPRLPSNLPPPYPPLFLSHSSLQGGPSSAVVDPLYQLLCEPEDIEEPARTDMQSSLTQTFPGSLSSSSLCCSSSGNCISCGCGRAFGGTCNCFSALCPCKKLSHSSPSSSPPLSRSTHAFLFDNAASAANANPSSLPSFMATASAPLSFPPIISNFPSSSVLYNSVSNGVLPLPSSFLSPSPTLPHVLSSNYGANDSAPSSSAAASLM